MAEFTKTKLKIRHSFNTRTNRHFLNNFQSVYHCHHYTVLYTQLALDAKETDLLANAAEESFFDILSSYFKENNITSIEERIEIACKYYSAMGLGCLKVKFLGDFSAKVISPSSHLEQGWIKKWGKYDAPINYIGSGYVSAMTAAILDAPIGSFKSHETSSIVMGDQETVFNVYKK